MKLHIFLTAVFAFTSLQSFAGEGGATIKVPVSGQTTGAPAVEAPAKKKSFNTNVYEKGSNERAFSAHVRMVRQNGTEWEILFDKPAGVYTVADEHQSALVDAQKNKTAVQVRVNEETNRILSVKATKPAAPAP